jgi:YD repeat-containing protein
LLGPIKSTIQKRGNATMNLRDCRISIPAVCFGLLAIMSPQSALAADCNPSLPFSYGGNCYATLAEAEAVMRGISGPTGAEENQDWRIYYELKAQVGNARYYDLQPRPHLPNPAWKTQMNREWETWGWRGFASPYFGTYVEAEEWLNQYAGIPSLEPSGFLPAFNQLVYRGTFNTTRYYSDVFLSSYPGVVDFSATWWMSCNDFTPGSINTKAGRATHSIYQPESAGPVPIMYRNAVVSCDDNGVPYKIWPINTTNIFQVGAGLCQTPYVSDGTECVSGLEEIIVEGGAYSVGAPEQPPPPCNGTNPCDPADGSKVQVEVDYVSPAIGGLEFKRYYRSKGPYKTDRTLATGWRHTYSRRLDEVPDVKPTTSFAAPVDQSSSYYTAAEACTSGWTEIKDTVWSGDLTSATATFSGGNTCKIEQNGAPVAYFPVRSAVGFGGFAQAPNIKTVTRPDGSVDTFEYDGNVWVNYLNPTLKLEHVGSEWIYTDANDTRETYSSAGNLIKIETREGLITTIQYGTSGYTLNKPTRVTGSFGHYIDLYYVFPTGELGSFAPLSFDRVFFNRSGVRLTGVTQTVAGGERIYLYERDDLPDHLTGIIDNNGDRFATWNYDNSGRAILSEHAGGKEQVVLAYNADDSTTLTMGNGATRTYHYVIEQGERKLGALTGDVCGTCSGGSVAGRTYDSNGFVDETEDWNGNVTQTIRNGQGLIEALIEAKGTLDERTTTTTWHPTFRLPAQIVSPKNTSGFNYDANGNLLSLTISGNSATRDWTFTYNASGQPLTIDGPRTDVNDVTTITYHACTTGYKCGQIATVTNALGHITRYDDPSASHDGSGRVTRMSDPNGLRTYFSYNGQGLLYNVRLYPPAGQGSARDTQFTYDKVGQLKTVTTPDGMVLTYSYDAAHYLRSVTDNFGNRIDYDYDAMGNIKDADTYDPGSTLKRAVDYVHDINNWLDTVSDGGFVTDFTLDLVGNLTDEIDPNTAHTEHVYDALNRLERTIDALSGLTDYSYDEHDNIVSVLAPNGAQTTYVYDDLDNLVQEASPDRGTLTYTHDDAGNRITELDARGKLTSYSYDALNRLTLVMLNGAARSLTSTMSVPMPKAV